MRSIWKGAISFGLVTIPVKLYSATQENDVSFHQVHRTDGGRIRYKRTCSIDGAEVSYGDIAKGYELPGGETVILTDEDFADLPLTTSRSIDVLQFVPLEQVDPIYFAKSYYLEPEGTGTRPYVLLRDALESSGRVALVKIALRQRESLATLRVRDGVFVLEMMLWPDEIRTPAFPFLDESTEVRPQELQMATSLIDTLAADFEPELYSDNYREALQALINAKVEGREVVAPVEAPSGGGTVVDLMSALRASVEAAKRGREGVDAAAAVGEAGADEPAADDAAVEEVADQVAASPKRAGRAASGKAGAGRAPSGKAGGTGPASGRAASRRAASGEAAVSGTEPGDKASASSGRSASRRSSATASAKGAAAPAESAAAAGTETKSAAKKKSPAKPAAKASATATGRARAGSAKPTKATAPADKADKADTVEAGRGRRRTA